MKCLEKKYDDIPLVFHVKHILFNYLAYLQLTNIIDSYKKTLINTDLLYTSI